MIRFAEEKDLNRVNELRKQVNTMHVKGRPDIFKAGFGKELETYAHQLVQDEQSNILVAEHEGVICGMVCVRYVNEPETAYGMARNFCMIEEIAVDPQFQHQGIGRELFAFLKEDAKQRGMQKIELEVWSFNKHAIEFYEALGFQETRKYMEYDLKF